LFVTVSVPEAAKECCKDNTSILIHPAKYTVIKAESQMFSADLALLCWIPVAKGDSLPIMAEVVMSEQMLKKETPRKRASSPGRWLFFCGWDGLRCLGCSL